MEEIKHSIILKRLLKRPSYRISPLSLTGQHLTIESKNRTKRAEITSSLN